MKKIKSIDTILLIFGFLLLLIGINSDRFISNEIASLIFGVITIFMALLSFNVNKLLGEKSVQNNKNTPIRQQKILFVSSVFLGLVIAAVLLFVFYRS